jgi:hypothetical protein
MSKENKCKKCPLKKDCPKKKGDSCINKKEKKK